MLNNAQFKSQQIDNHIAYFALSVVIFTNIRTSIVVAVAMMATPVTNSGKCYVAKFPYVGQ